MIQLLELILCKTSCKIVCTPLFSAPLNAQGAYALTLSKSAIMKWQSVDGRERLSSEFHLRPISHCRTKVCFLLKEFHQLLVQQLGQMFGSGSVLGTLGIRVPSHNAPTTLDFWKKSKGKMTVSLIKTRSLGFDSEWSLYSLLVELQWQRGPGNYKLMSVLYSGTQARRIFNKCWLPVYIGVEVAIW